MHGGSMKEIILDSIRPVIENLEHVWIDENRLRSIGRSLDETILELPTWSDPVIYPREDGGVIPYLLLFNTINFAFWGADKWRVEYDGQVLDGAYGLMAALTRAVEEGIPILEGAYLREMTEERLRHILRGEGELLLFGERVEILREVGEVLVGEFGGSFSRLYAAAGGSAPCLVNLLVEHFPSFRDVASLDGADVKFYKRAQLAPMMIYERFEGRGEGALEGIDDLTVAADYKLPQGLRVLAILGYHDELAEKVDAMVEIPSGGREEIEIRAATVWACELLRSCLWERLEGTTSLHVDYYLWSIGRSGLPVKPYHRTRTIFY